MHSGQVIDLANHVFFVLCFPCSCLGTSCDCFLFPESFLDDPRLFMFLFMVVNYILVFPAGPGQIGLIDARVQRSWDQAVITAPPQALTF